MLKAKKDPRTREQELRQRLYLEQQEEVAKEFERRAVEALKNRSRFVQLDKVPRTVEFELISRACPKLGGLMADSTVFTRQVLDMVRAIRPIANRDILKWRPVGKSKWTLFYSLANYLCGNKFSIPNFLWHVFENISCSRDSLALIRMTTHIAAGKSLYQWVSDEIKPKMESTGCWTVSAFAIPMTRKMCHLFLTKSDNSLDVLSNIRLAIVRGLGGDERLARKLLELNWTRILNTKPWEEFNIEMVKWIINQPMLDINRIPELYDFCQHERARDNSWSFKGRNGSSLMRDVDVWHNFVSSEKSRVFIRFNPSGFEGKTYDLSTENKKKIWTFAEILDSRSLSEEGRRQGHCVSSYSHHIVSGRTSIWTLVLENNEGRWANLTLEVDNRDSSVVQVRGRFNRLPTAEETAIVNQWCGDSGLKLSRWFY